MAKTYCCGHAMPQLDAYCRLLRSKVAVKAEAWIAVVAKIVAMSKIRAVSEVQVEIKTESEA